MHEKSISVIIPTWNESGAIEACLASVRALGPLEMIVSDGHSEDDTLGRVRRFETATRSKVIVVETARGRGVQLRSGAEAASGDVLLFLHADCQLHQTSLDQIRSLPRLAWGGFQQHIADRRWRFRALERGNAVRVRATGRVFGDQAIFVPREWYDRVGGFDPVELMEDVMISARLRKIAWPTLLPGRLTVDPRRWHRRGVVSQTWLNWKIQLAFARGVSPAELKRRYV